MNSPNSEAFKQEVILEVATQLQREKLRTDEIEAAFSEGYDVGYKNGQDDYGRFELGGGWRTIKGQKDDQDIAWEDSDCKARSENPA